MQIIFLILCLIFALFVILKSGDLLVDSAINIASNTGIGEQFVGLTLVSFATTAPELFVSCISASKGKAEMCINNGLGSILCNIGLILAISLLFFKHKIEDEKFSFKGLTLIFVFLLLFVFALNGNISKVEGYILIFVYVLFLAISVLGIKNNKQNAVNAINKKQLAYSFAVFVIGAIGVAISANMLVNVCISLARQLKISEGIIAITVLALGTALPELVSVVSAIKKKTLDLALGNIVGANIMNGTVLVGMSAILSPEKLCLNMQTKFITILFCIILNLVLVLPILKWRKTFKIQGLTMLFLFIVYYLIIFLF